MQRTTTTTTQEQVGGTVFEGWMRERAPHEARLRTLWAMTPAERVAAMYRGDLTYPQLTAWAAARPDEVPLVDGEFWFIAISTPESAEPDHIQRQAEWEYEAQRDARAARKAARKAEREAKR